jgi:hypothetical protein
VSGFVCAALRKRPVYASTPPLQHPHAHPPTHTHTRPPARLLRHFAVLAVPPPSDTGIKAILSGILSGFLLEFPPEVRRLAGSVVTASVEAYSRCAASVCVCVWCVWGGCAPHGSLLPCSAAWAGVALGTGCAAQGDDPSAPVFAAPAGSPRSCSRRRPRRTTASACGTWARQCRACCWPAPAAARHRRASRGCGCTRRAARTATAWCATRTARCCSACW